MISPIAYQQALTPLARQHKRAQADLHSSNVLRLKHILSTPIILPYSFGQSLNEIKQAPRLDLLV